jgi:CARDB
MMSPAKFFTTALVFTALALPVSPSLAQQGVVVPGGPIIPLFPFGRVFYAGQLPDLVIDSVTAAPFTCIGPDTVGTTLTVTIRNAGKAAAVMQQPLAWAPWVATSQLGLPPFTIPALTNIASGAPAQLLPKQTKTFKVWVFLKPFGSAVLSYVVKVDPSNWILESNEGNNLYAASDNNAGKLVCK